VLNPACYKSGDASTDIDGVPQEGLFSTDCVYCLYAQTPIQSSLLSRSPSENQHVQLTGGSATLMDHNSIKQAIDSGKLKIDGFDEKSLNPASYDARIGKWAFSSSVKQKTDVESKGSILLEPGDFAVVTTFEKFELPLDVAGLIGIRSHYARKGIIELSGPQVDPGFKGVLVIGLFNASPRGIIIPYKEPFLTIDFVQLVQPAKEGYKGPYQDQDTIPTADIEWLTETKGMSFGEVVKTLGSLSNNVSSLATSMQSFEKSVEKSISRMEWVMGVAFAVIGAIVAIGTFLR